MFNKKATGIQWYIALIVFIMGIGIVMSTKGIVTIPKIGEYSLNLMKSLERGNEIPVTVKGIMEQLNKKAHEGYENHAVFRLKTYCEGTAYKDSLINSPVDEEDDKTFMDIAGILGRTGETRVCYVNENDLTQYYGEVFNNKYVEFKAQEHEGLDLDFSTISYTSTVTKESSEYFNKVETLDAFELPIELKKEREETQIGTFKVAPNFKLATENPVSHPFDTTEVCIFSRDCGATCQDVVNKYPAKNYKILDFSCGLYFNCQEGEDAIDDFGNYYLCNDDFLCKNGCSPFCSSTEEALVTDDDIGLESADKTACTEFSCSNYMDCGFINTDSFTCTDVCSGEGKWCIRGIDNGVQNRGCSESFTFEGGDDYCICGSGLTKIVPAPPTDEQDTCNSKCGGNEFCMIGIDDGSDIRRCDESFRFEGGQDDDYCICGKLSEKLSPTLNCACPDPSAITLDKACSGNNCINLHCDRDVEYEAQQGVTTTCRIRGCNNYGDCISTSSCSCDSVFACQGTCTCTAQGWYDEGGCGDTRSDGVTCSWLGVPQRQDYLPSTCSDPNYGCDDRSHAGGQCECTQGSWVDTDNCGEITQDGVWDCEWYEKPQRLDYYPPGCGSAQYGCSYSASCDCSLDGIVNTKCLDDPCSSYDSCITSSTCGCSSGYNACEGSCTSFPII